MSYISLTRALLAATLLSFSVGIAAETPDVEPITDPDALQARGFDPDGPPIYRFNQQADERALDVRIEEREQIESQIALAGVSVQDVNWASVQATDFQFLADQNSYTTLGNHSLSCNTDGTNLFADAPIRFARNRRLRFLDVWTRDDSVDHNVDVALYQACQPMWSGGAPVVTELGLIAGSGSSGERFQFISLPEVYAQNRTCTYWVRAMFSSCAAGTTVAVHKVRVIWD
jgi:hypothetical protein